MSQKFKTSRAFPNPATPETITRAISEMMASVVAQYGGMGWTALWDTVEIGTESEFEYRAWQEVEMKIITFSVTLLEPGEVERGAL